MTKRISADSLKVISSGVQRDGLPDVGSKAQSAEVKRVGRLRARSRGGDREASVQWARELLGSDYPGTEGGGNR